ncbi:nuclear transport factor 2 family protein [Nonomuraea sp. NPDC048916]|uniref:nuclear transport factor 2 family protein n=1 Tax=Nonomuraea sp. NPDC048916 TaxID=3154232 RepID=UPI0033E15474
MIKGEGAMYVTRHQAMRAVDGEAVSRELKDRVEIVDALYRFGLGQDLRDRDLFASAFSADAELDFRPAAAKLGVDSELMAGRETIVETILGVLAQVETTHVVTNPRVQLDGEVARLTAIVEAQHLLATDHSRYALLKNLYAVELVRDGERWVIRRLDIDNVWYTGEPKAIFGG